MEKEKGWDENPALFFIGVLEYWNVGVLETCIELST
jgi:hypothetical protein